MHIKKPGSTILLLQNTGMEIFLLHVLLQCDLLGAALEDHFDNPTFLKYSSVSSDGCTLIFCELHRLLFCFLVWFKLLAITYEALHGIWFGCLRDHTPIVSAWLNWSGRVATLWVPSIKQCHLSGPWNHAFSVQLTIASRSLCLIFLCHTFPSILWLQYFAAVGWSYVQSN